MTNFCPVCQANTVEHQPLEGLDICTVCGQAADDTSSSFQVLGRVLDEGSAEPGRAFLHGGQLSNDALGRSVETNRLHYEAKKRSETERYMKRVLQQFGIVNLFGRAKALFDEAKVKGGFTWGNKSDVVGVASIYVAARERNSSIRLVDLSDSTTIDVKLLSRAQAAIRSWLKIKLPNQEPIVFIDPLVIYLTALTNGTAKDSPITLNATTLKFLRIVDMARVRSIAGGVLDLSMSHDLVDNRVPEHVAVAAIIVGIEGAARAIVPFANDIMTALASRLGLPGAFTAGERYREINKLLGDWVESVPWISAPAKGKEYKKKDLVKYTEDIVTFSSGLRQKKAKPKISHEEVTSELEEEEDELVPSSAIDPALQSVPVKLSQIQKDHDAKIATRTSKRPTEYMRIRPANAKRARTLEQSAGALSSTITTSLPSRSSSDIRIDPLAPHDEAAVRIRQQLLAGKAVTEIIQQEEKEEEEDGNPGRLTQLLWSKSADEIDDEELFDEGELEGFVRAQDEVDVLANLPKFREMEHKTQEELQLAFEKLEDAKARRSNKSLDLWKNNAGSVESPSSSARKPRKYNSTSDIIPSTAPYRSQKTKVDSVMSSKIAALLQSYQQDDGDDEETAAMLGIAGLAEDY